MLAYQLTHSMRMRRMTRSMRIPMRKKMKLMTMTMTRKNLASTLMTMRTMSLDSMRIH